LGTTNYELLNGPFGYSVLRFQPPKGVGMGYNYKAKNLCVVWDFFRQEYRVFGAEQVRIRKVFDLTNEEEKDFGYFSKILAEGGAVSHLIGCHQCKGTHNYKGGWSFLDVMAFSPNLPQAAGLSLIPESIEVVRTPENTKKNGTPLRFNDEKREGVSDHFPLYSRLKISKTIKPTLQKQ
jgi:hypothetical protein